MRTCLIPILELWYPLRYEVVCKIFVHIPLVYEVVCEMFLQIILVPCKIFHYILHACFVLGILEFLLGILSRSRDDSQILHQFLIFDMQLSLLCILSRAGATSKSSHQIQLVET